MSASGRERYGPADFRNRAERAAVRAALADAGVRGVGRGGQHAVVGVVGVVVHAVGLAHAAKRLLQRVGQLLILVDAHQQVDFRNLLHQILLVALGKAARDHQRTALADLLVPRHVENRVDGLLLRRRDEPAGVHHQHIRLRGVVRQLIPVLPQQPQRGLAIHAVLITSQRNHSNLEFRHCFLLQFMGETQGALPLDPSRALPCTREGSSTLSTPISRLSWSLFHAMPACLSTGYPHCPPYPQVTAKTSNRSVHCEGVKGASADVRLFSLPPCRSRRSEIPLRHEKSSHTGKTHAKNQHREQRLWGKIANSPIVHFTTKISI